MPTSALIRRAFGAAIAHALVVTGLCAQATSAATLDDSIPSGANFAIAQFRLWLPTSPGTLRGALILNPGSNGDGRSQVNDSVWQRFATEQHLALVGVRLTDKPHDNAVLEEYVNVSLGSGQALLDALGHFAERSKHPELAKAPLLLWGMSAGGEFNYEFNAWKPERVIAFVVNKGGIYYSALVPRAARETPGILFVGGKDLAFRTNTIVGLFAVNRRAGAIWALAEEPDAAHIVGKSRDVALGFYADAIARRLGNPVAADGTTALKPVLEREGFIGDFADHTFKAMGDARSPGVPTAWLLTERVAKAWQAITTGQPIP